MKQTFKCLKVKILDTINMSFAATDIAKVSSSPERFLYTYNIYIIPDNDFYFQRGQILNPNCPFNCVSSPDLTVTAETCTILQKVVFRLPKQLLLWAPRAAFYWLFLVGCRKYRCHLHSFFLIHASREIHHRFKHSWAGTKIFNKGESQVLIYCCWEGKGNIIPPSDDLGTASCREQGVLQDLWWWWTHSFLLWFSLHTLKASFQQAQSAENIRLLIMQHRTATQLLKEQFCISTRWNSFIYHRLLLYISFSFLSTA